MYTCRNIRTVLRKYVKYLTSLLTSSNIRTVFSGVKFDKDTAGGDRNCVSLPWQKALKASLVCLQLGYISTVAH